MESGATQTRAKNPSSPGETGVTIDIFLRQSDIPEQQAEILQTNLATFMKNQKKDLFDSDSRKVRDSISSIFFDIYETVFKKTLTHLDDNSEAYRCFLTTCHIDKDLLTPEQDRELNSLVTTPLGASKEGIYTLNEWLEKIYTSEKDPSVNEFGQDYFEVFREKKKRGEVTEKDRISYEGDRDARLKHEIENLFKLGQRLCYGQMHGYLPILHSGMISSSLQQALVTPEKLAKSLRKILDVDYSAFHREIVYSNSGKNIKNELVMMPVRPDIILMPTFGTRAVMWQELTGKAKNTPGRILFPLFTTEDLDDMMAEVVAKFRWSLSKSMVGFIRQDTQTHNLFTDYYDYLQFYKKNRDLSTEAREKVKTQVDKYRNNVAEIFAADYQTWINYESKGLVRLNKVARSIMLKYCPFSAEIRNELIRHPLYSKEITSFNANLARQAKITEARYARLRKPNVPLDRELEEHLADLNM